MVPEFVNLECDWRGACVRDAVTIQYLCNMDFVAIFVQGRGLSSTRHGYR